jgi:hypothetical protein
VIRYALICDKRHEFESWFSDSSTYDTQARRGLVSCPVCGSVKVEKAIMAPALARKDKTVRQPDTVVTTEEAKVESPAEKNPVAIVSEQEREIRTKLKELREHLTKNADYVGPKFPEEARRMHYGEIEHRSIYGEASPEEANELHEEGIEFHPLPRIPDERN